MAQGYKIPKAGSRLLAATSNGYHHSFDKGDKKAEEMPWLCDSQEQSISSIQKLLQKRNRNRS